MTERPGKDLVFHGTFGVAAFLASGGWLWAWIALKDITQPLILHFSDYTGINQIGGMAEVHGIGATGVIMVAMDYVLARALRARDPRWAAIVAGAALFLAALLFTALVAIISLNQ